MRGATLSQAAAVSGAKGFAAMVMGGCALEGDMWWCHGAWALHSSSTDGLR